MCGRVFWGDLAMTQTLGASLRVGGGRLPSSRPSGGPVGLGTSDRPIPQCTYHAGKVLVSYDS